MEFWESLKALIPIEIPEYLKTILSDTGFNNYLSLEALDENVISSIEENNKILLGHKIMLMKIRDIIRTKGIEQITEFERDRVKNIAAAAKSMPPPFQRNRTTSNNIDLNAEEIVLRNMIKDLLKKLSFEEVCRD